MNIYKQNIIQVSRLVASEIIRGATMASRIAVIEKWVAVADICRCLHNYNGVLQVRGDPPTPTPILCSLLSWGETENEA